MSFHTRPPSYPGHPGRRPHPTTGLPLARGEHLVDVLAAAAPRRQAVRRHAVALGLGGWGVVDPARDRVGDGGATRSRETTTPARDRREVTYRVEPGAPGHLVKVLPRRRRRGEPVGASPVDVYAARLTALPPGRRAEDGHHDGLGEWVPLVVAGRSRVPGLTTSEVLAVPDAAAAVAGATGLGAPRAVAVAPVTQHVHVATAWSRGPAGDRGLVLRVDERRGDAAGLSFAWQVVLVTGDPDDPGSSPPGFGAGEVSPVGCPAALGFDGGGRPLLATEVATYAPGRGRRRG